MRCSRVLLLAALTVAIAAGVAPLIPATTAVAAVYPPGQVLPAQTIQEFIAKPGALLTEFPDGGPHMIKRVRDLAGSDPATVDALIGLLSTANPKQASAIGTALGHVALMAVGHDQAFATHLQDVVFGSGNTDAMVAFSAVVGGDIKLTAATGTTGGVGGGGGPTGQNGGGGGFAVNNAENFSTSHENTPDSFPPIVLGGSGPGSITQSVSP